MEVSNLSVFIVPSSDPHQSEYVADHWAALRWLTSFTGSAGTALVTPTHAMLWTDSRYHIQAEGELQEFDLQKSGLSDTPSIDQWITDHTMPGDRIGIDGRLFSKSMIDEMQSALVGRNLISTDDPFREIWADRPPLPNGRAHTLDMHYAGESRLSKIARIRHHNATTLITTLDEIAWLLNIRGSDIEYNPLVISYLSIEPCNILLFVDVSKFTDADITELRSDGIEFRQYEQWSIYLSHIDCITIVNPSQLDINSYSLLRNPAEDSTPTVAMAKAEKNRIEVDGFRQAMIEDGVALCRFLIWLEHADGVTEYEVAKRLHAERSRSQSYRGDSFASIVAYGPNGAQAHYSPHAKGSTKIERDNFLLIDSGGQYLYGTTDITRTYHRGTPTSIQRRDYTNVLMGMIDLSRAHFPIGTRGAQLDAIARQHLWHSGDNYLHGTGHGIGHFLCVHEGPQSIRMNENPIPLRQGMVQSIEPAIYRAGEYGIRTENLVVVRASEHTGFNCFETLTLFPIETSAIEHSMMSSHHIEWLNQYHAMVRERLSPYLDEDQQLWLKTKTEPL